MSLGRRSWLPLTFLALLGLGGGDSEAIELLVVAHEDVESDALSRGELSAIYRAVRREWPSGERIVAFNLAALSDERIEFDRAVLRMEPDDVTRFWIDERIRGGGRPPRTVPSVELMGRVVKQVPGAIGYVSADQSTDGLRIVARIVNQEVVEP